MKKIVLPIVVVVFLLLAVAFMAGLFSQRVEPGLADQNSAAAPETVAATVLSIQPSEAVSATLAARETTVLSSRVLASITSMQVVAGSQVQRGQLLATLDQADFASRVQQAKSSVEVLEAQLTEAQRNLQRARDLQQSGALSVADLDRSQANYDSLNAQLSGAKQAMVEAQTTLSFTQIHAPIDGLVVDRYAEPGDIATPGMRLLAIYNPTTLRVEAQVRESLAVGLQVGQRLEAEVPSVGLVLDAVIEERVPAATSASRTFLVKAALDYHPELLPGMYARLEIPLPSAEVIAIPQNLVYQQGQQDLVYVLQDGQLVRRYVQIGKLLDGQMREIVSGLSADDRVSVAPAP